MSLATVLPVVLAELGGDAYLLLARRRRPARVAGMALVVLALAQAGVFAGTYVLYVWALQNGFPLWLTLAWRVQSVALGLFEAGTLAVVVWAVVAGHGRAGADDD